MPMLSRIIDFLKLLFSPKNPEIQKNQQLKVIDARLSKITPSIYNNGQVQVAFAEALFSVYTNIGIFSSLLSFVQLPEQKLVKNRVYDTLIKSGYNDASLKKVESLTYEMRKKVLDSSLSRDKDIAEQAQVFLAVQKDLHTTGFAQIEKTLQDLELFYDLSNFNFVNILKSFDPSFSPLDSKPNFTSLDCETISDELLNLYYVSAKLKLTGSLGRAITAVATIIPGQLNNMSQDQLMVRLKKIATALNRALAPDVLKDIIAIGKRKAEIEPEYATSTANPLEEYSLRQKARFAADTERLNVEFQDQERSREIQDIFGDKQLLSLECYNSQVNEVLQSDSSCSFLWITPMQVIKTFLFSYLGLEIQSLLNDIVVEGFFATNEAKTDFSSSVFDCLESFSDIKGFENSFARNEKYDSALLQGYIKDSKKDPEFARTLGKMVSEINENAKRLTQKQSTSIYELYKLLLTTLEDSRRSNPELITNIKFLFTSSRNKEAVDLLEKSLPKWGAFLNLMKHYAQLGNIEVSREEKRQNLNDDESIK